MYYKCNKCVHNTILDCVQQVSNWFVEDIECVIIIVYLMEMLQLKLSASVHGLCFIASDQSVHAIT